jgi:hypothetical protein
MQLRLSIAGLQQYPISTVVVGIFVVALAQFEIGGGVGRRNRNPLDLNALICHCFY